MPFPYKSCNNTVIKPSPYIKNIYTAVDIKMLSQKYGKYLLVNESIVIEKS